MPRISFSLCLTILSLSSSTYGLTINQITHNTWPDYCPRVSENHVIWSSDQENTNTINLYDGVSTKILGQAIFQPDISGSNVVWDTIGSTSLQIALYDGNSTRQLTIFIQPGNSPPRISGDHIAWRELYGNNSLTWHEEIKVYDLATGTANQITDNPLPYAYKLTNPAISGSTVVWGQDFLLMQYNIATGQTRQIYESTDYGIGLVEACGSNVIWRLGDDNRSSFDELFFYDGTTIKSLGVGREPVVSESYAAWIGQGTDGRSSGLFVYDIATGQTIQMAPDFTGQNLSLSGSTLVWDWYTAYIVRDGQLMPDDNSLEIFTATIPEPLTVLTLLLGGWTLFRRRNKQ